MLHIDNLSAAVADGHVPVLKRLSLYIKPGEVHAIMGPNGSGGMAHVLAGMAGSYQPAQSDRQNVAQLEPEARAGPDYSSLRPGRDPWCDRYNLLRTAYNAMARAVP